jgi:adenine deaminase
MRDIRGRSITVRTVTTKVIVITEDVINVTDILGLRLMHDDSKHQLAHIYTLKVSLCTNKAFDAQHANDIKTCGNTHRELKRCRREYTQSLCF